MFPSDSLTYAEPSTLQMNDSFPVGPAASVRLSTSRSGRCTTVLPWLFSVASEMVLP
jgi:hypothetical protein